MRFKNLKSRRGFTLIEIMIVVFIIALLSTAAVGGYTRYRKISLLELAADNIVSTIYQARDSVKMGKTGVSGEAAKCYGVVFDKNSDSPVSKVSVGFDLIKKWKNGKWVDGSCESAEGGGEPIDLEDLVIIEKISADETDRAECDILFSPPSGEASTSCGDAVKELSFLIKYSEEVDESYQRTIKFNLKSGIANVEKL